MAEPQEISDEQSRVLRAARMLLELGYTLEQVLQNPIVPSNLRNWLTDLLNEEENRTFEPARQFVATPDRPDWLAAIDRSSWHYWPALRTYLLTSKGWPRDTVRSLDEASDKVLRQLAPPDEESFDIRGLVLGYVQSGKTANFTALVAKAADAGYRLVIVLSGIDNGLRRQTQLRLNRELVGAEVNTLLSVRLPPVGKRWHQFTTEDINGDFHPGRVNHAALQGSQPVLLVVKKNGPVLRRLRAWLQTAPAEARSSLPVLFVDDEADQASIDVRGSYQNAGEAAPDSEYEPPSVINGLIRELLFMFTKRAYVAYTATPFANILIPHDTVDPTVGSDLYPKDFIIDLPKPHGYFGTEEFFGRFDPIAGNVTGLDVLRTISESELATMASDGTLPESLGKALCAFVLGGAARASRGKPDAPCTMLVHTSQRIASQSQTKTLVEQRFKELRDDWRYDRGREIRANLKALWDDDFRPTTDGVAGMGDASFEEIEPFIGPFFEAVVVREINSETGDVLDYEREPSLKAIAIGGNRLARGLTLEGLLVSYFARRTPMYDTLMQMGRWFGYRGGYQDLTRIYTTATLAQWFTDLAQVEHRLREDIQVYENMGVRPEELGARILTHPAMQVTSSLKRRFASDVRVSQTYAGQLEQTFKFPFSNEEALALLCEKNRLTTMTFLNSLGTEYSSETFGPLWEDVSAESIVQYLRQFEVDSTVNSLSPDLMATYIERLNLEGELVNWSVLVRGRNAEGNRLGEANWVPGGTKVWNLDRTRIRGTNSMGVITSSGDEAFGLSDAERTEMSRKLSSAEEKDQNRAARFSRSPRCGLLILYPISKYSGHIDLARSRVPLYENPESGSARDIIGLAVSFPNSNQPARVEGYLEGTARWRPVA